MLASEFSFLGNCLCRACRYNPAALHENGFPEFVMQTFRDLGKDILFSRPASETLRRLVELCFFFQLKALYIKRNGYAWMFVRVVEGAVLRIFAFSFFTFKGTAQLTGRCDLKGQSRKFTDKHTHTHTNTPTEHNTHTHTTQ